MKSLNQFIKKLFSEKRFVVALSVALAFAFWLVIAIDQNPVRQKTLNNISISVDVSSSVAGNLGLDIVNNDYTKYASVTVEGPNYIVSSLKSGDISVVADLSDVTETGTKTVSLRAQREGGTSGYSFISISPSTIELTFDYFDNREFVVEAKADGIKAVDGLIADTPIVSSLVDSKITVRGPKKQVDLIDRIVATVNKTEILDATKSFEASIFIYDADGNILDNDNFEFSTEEIKVTVPICKQKVLPVVPTFVNESYEGLGMSLIKSMSVESVTVIGPEDAIDTLQAVELSTIDFTGVKPDNRTFEASLSLPEGVRSLGSVETVTVEFDIASYKTKSFKVSKSNVIFKNLDSQLKAQITSSQDITVTLCGQSKALNNLSSSDFKIEVDLSGKTAGQYNVTPTVALQDNSPIWQIGSLTVTVNIN